MLTKNDKTVADVEEGKKEKIIDNLKGFTEKFVNCIANASFDMPSNQVDLSSNQTSGQVLQQVTSTDQTPNASVAQVLGSETPSNQANSSESYSSLWSWLGYSSPTPPGSPEKTSTHSSAEIPEVQSTKPIDKKVESSAKMQKYDSRSLIEVFKQADTRYNNSDSYWSLISWLFRRRSFGKTINDLKSFPDPILRLQAFYLFTSEQGGTWHIGSANTALYIAAIRAIPDYENDRQSLSDEFIHEVLIPHLRPLVNLEIIARIEKRAEFLRKKEEERRQVEEDCRVFLNQAAEIELFDNAELARKEAVDNPTKQVFHLSARTLSAKELQLKQKRTKAKVDENELVWQFTWYDSTGNPNLLEMTSGLESLLTSFNLIKRPEESGDSEIKLKLTEFSRLEKEYEERTSVVLEPSAEELEDLKSSYAITKKDRQYQLTWYDNQGNPVPLVLSHHYLLATWLATKEALTIEDLPILKIYLQPQFANPELSIKMCCSQLAEEHLARTKVLIDPRSDLSFLSLTYVLTQDEGQYQLTWFDSFCNPNPVNLENHEALSKWLKTKTAVSHEDMSQLRTYLQHVKMRNEVDQSVQKGLGRKILEKKGVTLICTDNLEGIPPYKLSAGIYILTRSPDPKTGEWILYQRQKGGENIRVNISAAKTDDSAEAESVKTNDWEDFHKFLAEKEAPFSAAQLSLGDQAELKKKIMAIIPMPKETNLCTAVEVFNEKKAHKFTACTFVVTKKDSEWQLIYIDILQRAIPVPVSNENLPAVNALFNKWKGDPQSLANEQLKELSGHLIGYKPMSQIKMSKFSLVAKCIASQASILHSQEGTSTQEETTRQSIPEPGRINLSNFAKITELWGQRPVYKPVEKTSTKPASEDPSAFQSVYTS
jgi:hypothetical protein